MGYMIFTGFADVYPEKIEGTSQWFYGQVTPCSEAYEVPAYNGNYSGTRLYIFNIDRKVYEPFKQEKNVFINPPVYSNKHNSFEIVRFDFNKSLIQAFEYVPEPERLTPLVELAMSEFDDIVNIRIIKEPFTLIKYDGLNDSVRFIWPEERQYQLEVNEILCFLDDGMLITTKWYEDPDYREEVIFRNSATGEVVDRKAGYISVMPNGEKWLMTD